MFVFYKKDMKYPVVCTEDQHHWILVGADDAMADDFGKEVGLSQGKEGYYIVHHSDREDLFSLACASLPQRLNPMITENDLPGENFFSMHKYFYRNKNRDLIVKGIYFGTEGEENPFKEADVTAPGFKCLADIHLVK